MSDKPKSAVMFAMEVVVKTIPFERIIMTILALGFYNDLTMTHHMTHNERLFVFGYLFWMILSHLNPKKNP